MAVLHGLGVGFTVDEVTLGLLLLAGVPVLAAYVDTVKGGSLEVKLRDLSDAQQIAVFLEAVARRHPWTFYEPRPGESGLGRAFGMLVDEMRRTDSEAFHALVRRLMESPDVNHRYFAAEVIGHFRIDELRQLLRAGLGGKPGERLPLWRLNCKWAESRFDGYASLHEALREGNPDTQLWLLQAYLQMPTEEPKVAGPFADVLRGLLKGPDLDPRVRDRATEVLGQISRPMVSLVSPQP